MTKYWKNADAQFGANVSGKRKRVPSSKMTASTTHQKGDGHQCLDTGEKEKKKKSPVAANPTGAMCAAAPFKVFLYIDLGRCRVGTQDGGLGSRSCESSPSVLTSSAPS